MGERQQDRTGKVCGYGRGLAGLKRTSSSEAENRFLHPPKKVLALTPL